ncbi:hypothetical protein Ais01nite_77450 [Asanoa ishikariensis]|nr:hypothetical protein Ais01nite_77450 [Asanoa ishikariensis]
MGDTPESITATVIPAPSLIGQARSGRIRCSGQGVSVIGDPLSGGPQFGAFSIERPGEAAAGALTPIAATDATTAAVATAANVR